MKNTKLFSILAIVLAVVLLACGAFLGFDRGADIGGSYVLSVQLNETFNVKDAVHSDYFFGTNVAAKLTSLTNISIELKMKLLCHCETFFLFI